MPLSRPTCAPRSQPNTEKGALFAIPVNDPDSSYDYPEQVRLELTQEDIASYERAADFLNFNSNDLVCLQHEYGIYGGAAGRYILALLRRLKMPLVTTLHTVLREPDANQRIVLEEIAQLSDRMIVMSELAAQLLREVYAVPGRKDRCDSARRARICPSWTPIISRTSSARKASPFCLHSACYLQTRELKT